MAVVKFRALSGVSEYLSLTGKTGPFNLKRVAGIWHLQEVSNA